jgi:Flp pilus assembly pilin Flp
MRALRQSRFWQDDGQDLVEYTLLMAFVVVVSAALFLYNSDTVAAIWNATNNNLGSANSVASS